MLTALILTATRRSRAYRALFIASLTLPYAVAGAQQTRQAQSSRYRVARGPGDTLNAGVINATAVTFQADSAASRNYGPGGQMRVVWRADAFGTSVRFRLDAGVNLQAGVDAALGARAVASRAIVDNPLRSLPEFAASDRSLVAAKLPFELYDVDGRRADVVMLQRHVSGNSADSLLANSRLFGTGIDTVRVQVPPDVWLPGDALYVIGTRAAGRFVLMKLTLGCAPNGMVPARITCNPLALGTKGATGYRYFEPGYESVWHVDGGSPR